MIYLILLLTWWFSSVPLVLFFLFVLCFSSLVILKPILVGKLYVMCKLLCVPFCLSPAWGIWARGRMLKARQLSVCYVPWGAALALSEPQAPPWPCGVAEAAGRRLRGGKMGQQRHLCGPGSRPGGSGFRCQDESQGFTPRAGGPVCF